MGIRQIEAPHDAYVVKIYTLLGFLSLTLFGTLHIFYEGEAAVGYLELAGGAIMALNVLALRITQNVGLARSLFLATFMCMLVVMLGSGGTGGTGIFWFFLFPIAAFFLTDKRSHGAVWVGSLVGLVVTLWLLDNFGWASIWYGDVAIRQMLVSLLVVTIGISVYQRSREQANLQSSESQHDLQEYLDRMTTYNAKLDPTGKILFANKILRDAYPPGKPVIDSNFLDAPWWRDATARMRVKNAFHKALSGLPVRYDERFMVTTPDGRRERTFSLSMIPVRDKGRTQYILTEARDITVERAVDRAKSEFVTLASHQLRTPIAAIRWFSEMLLNGDAGELNKEQQEHMDQIYRSNQRMANQVDEMLIVSSLELGSLPVAPEQIDVAVFCRKIVNSQSKAVAEKHLVIKDHYDPGIAELPLDPHILKIILRNLFTNAIKYTPDGGHISLEVTKTAKKLRPDSKGSLAIMVNDSGYGVPPEDQASIFEKFFRAQNAKQKDTDGTGLGLYMVKMLMDYIGGSISFTSTEDVGSTFVVELPIEGMKAHQPEGPSALVSRKGA